MIESVLLAVSARMAEKRTLCRVSAAKRILSSLELAAMNEKSCLIKSKRDIANLVGSYMEANLENLKRAQDQKNVIERLIGLLQDEYVRTKRDEFMRTKRAYCCSPKCDKFMSTMGNPDPMTVKCN